jgi:hypothetical protein
MYLDELPCVRVTDLRRSSAMTPSMSAIAVTLYEEEGAPVSAEVGIVRFRMPSGGAFLQFVCGHCGRRAQVLRLHSNHIKCGPCTGLRYWCEGKPAIVVPSIKEMVGVPNRLVDTSSLTVAIDPRI